MMMFLPKFLGGQRSKRENSLEPGTVILEFSLYLAVIQLFIILREM